jgi:hypothetical protein
VSTHYKYPPELLTQVAAQSRSNNEMLRRLGLPIVGGNHTHISRQVRRFGIDTSHFTHFGKHHNRHAYTREELAAAVAESRSAAEVLERLGVRPYDGAGKYIRRRCSHFGIDIRHFTRSKPPRAIAPGLLRDAVEQSRSIAEVIRRLGLPEGSSGYRLVHRWSREHGVDLGRLPGQAHQRGRGIPKLTARDLLRHDEARYKRVHAHLLRRALAEIGRPYACAECGTGDVWNGKPLVLEVDHINGDWRDNRRENVRYLCPSCHSQTDSYCGRNRGGAGSRSTAQSSNGSHTPQLG